MRKPYFFTMLLRAILTQGYIQDCFYSKRFEQDFTFSHLIIFGYKGIKYFCQPI